MSLRKLRTPKLLLPTTVISTASAAPEESHSPLPWKVHLSRSQSESRSDPRRSSALIRARKASSTWWKQCGTSFLTPLAPLKPCDRGAAESTSTLPLAAAAASARSSSSVGFQYADDSCTCAPAGSSSSIWHAILASCA